MKSFAVAAGTILAVLLALVLIHAAGRAVQAQQPPPASATVITSGAAWLGAEANQKVPVPCSWVLNNPYGEYLPPDGQVPVTTASWSYALNICDGLDTP